MSELTKPHQIAEEDSDSLPTQEQVDAIVHFVEAVRELKQSPFYIEEYSSLKLSMKEGATKDEVHAHLPDPSVMRGVIVPFRRVWQQNEPCHFTRVSNILKKHIPFFRVFIDPLAMDKTQDAVNLFPSWKNDELSYQDLIDVWLNTRFLHVGSSNKSGKFDRSDFEQLEGQIGTVLFEYYFALAIWEFGIYFFNILPFAEGFISDVAQRGLRPSFSMASAKLEESVRRATPGFTPEHETPAHRVWCLRRRRVYAAFNDFLRFADHSDQRAAELIGECDSFDQFSVQSGIKLSFQTEFEIPEGHQFSAFCGVIDEHMTAVRNQRRRRGFIGRNGDYSLVLGADALSIISEQYSYFRSALQIGNDVLPDDKV